MKSEIVLNLRRFPVLAHDHRTGQEEAITVTVAKQQLQAAQIVGQSSKELIEHLCERQGYSVIEIGKPDKLSVTLDLDALPLETKKPIDVTAGMKSFLARYGIEDREDRMYFIQLWGPNIVLQDSDDGGGSVILDTSKPGGTEHGV